MLLIDFLGGLVVTAFIFGTGWLVGSLYSGTRMDARRSQITTLSKENVRLRGKLDEIAETAWDHREISPQMADVIIQLTREGLRNDPKELPQ